MLNNIYGETVRLSTSDYPPYNSEILKHYGLIPRIVTEAFRLEGIDVEYEFFPWKRSYLASAAGDFHGTLQWYYSPEREKEHYYSDVFSRKEGDCLLT